MVIKIEKEVLNAIKIILNTTTELFNVGMFTVENAKAVDRLNVELNKLSKLIEAEFEKNNDSAAEL